MKGKPQIEQRQDNHPIGDEAVWLIGAPSAMLREPPAQRLPQQDVIVIDTFR
jgi:hypothetical protein